MAIFTKSSQTWDYLLYTQKVSLKKTCGHLQVDPFFLWQPDRNTYGPVPYAADTDQDHWSHVLCADNTDQDHWSPVLYAANIGQDHWSPLLYADDTDQESLESCVVC